MIKKIVTLALCLPLFALAQKEDLTYDQTINIKFVKQYKNNTLIDSYITKDGLIIRVGDTLTIGNAVIDRKKYIFHDVFSHIVIGKTKGTTNKEFRYLPHNYSGSKVIVKSLFVTHEKYSGYKLWPNRKEMPLYVSVFVREDQSGISKIFSHSRKTILDIEKALSSGEIINYNAPLSKEEAIRKLKESKDLMELNFLSKEEYEKLKENLTPIILEK
tara:strand:- start:229 stop:876 length:648 start_codon:yes stop_codon:yes gene_type:complete